MSSTRRPLSLRFFTSAVIFGALSIGAVGCSSADIDENDPAALAKEAEEDIDSSRYLLALEKLQKVKNQHPTNSK
jgi:outer membrane protein assembly factor BamD (BamD/ComL family)